SRRRAETALRTREALYRRVLDRLPDAAVVLFDKDLRYVLAGGEALQTTGPAPELLEGRTVREALPELADQLEPMYRAALAGMVLGVDVTEARESEQLISRLNRDLEKSVAELTAANEELEAFSYSVSHDLRAPLRHISGFVDLLRRGSADRLDEKGRRQLETIARAARQMGELIDDLLAFSRVSRTRPRREAVDLAFLVREVVQPIRLETAEHSIDWRIGDLPRVTADPSLLRIALSNLLGNAVKYSRTRERACIEVGTQPDGHGHSVPPGQAAVFVRDNGVGFDQEYAGKLFGVFQRLHRADEFEGTGIGLATVRRIVHRHGGLTWAEGRAGEGATFYFTLPVAEEPGSAEDGPRAERSA
ncbi:MAG TPA: ATP-binding protein, partial [Vicinamibacteria bacterium]|nr:ATP-binding protein [Vicinamibacteria bacterium]